MKIAYASDLHGQTRHYDELFSLAARERAEALVLGGDLLPSPHSLTTVGGRDEAVSRQKSYLLEDLLPRLEGFRASEGTAILLMLGNYDVRAVEEVFERECAARGLLTLHEQVRQVEGVTLAGLSWVNPTPFALKDWEVPDLEEDADQERAEVAAAEGDGRSVFTAERRGVPSSLGRALDLLAGKVPAEGRDAVYVTHAPPFRSALDLVWHGAAPVGSRAVRRFIEKRRPRLTLHGHIHESPQVSGSWAVPLGETLAIQPGQADEHLHAVVLDTDNPAETACHTILGPLGKR